MFLMEVLQKCAIFSNIEMQVQWLQFESTFILSAPTPKSTEWVNIPEELLSKTVVLFWFLFLLLWSHSIV